MGQPGYGTTLWSFVFEPNTADVQFQLENEIRRVANQDPRLIINTVKAYPQENGILLEIELAVSPFNQANTLSIFLNLIIFRGVGFINIETISVPLLMSYALSHLVSKTGWI